MERPTRKTLQITFSPIIWRSVTMNTVPKIQIGCWFFLWLMNIFLRTRWMTKLQFFWIIFLIKFENGKSNSGLHSLIQDRTGWGSDLLSMPPSILAILLNRYRVTWKGYSSIFFNMHGVTWMGYSSIFFNMHRVTWIGYSSIFYDMHRVTWTLLRNTLLPGCSAILKKTGVFNFYKEIFLVVLKILNEIIYSSCLSFLDWEELRANRSPILT